MVAPKPPRRNIRDETGNKHGSLTVRAYVPANLLLPSLHDVAAGSRAHWLCRCECGHWAIAPGNKLRLGRRKACGHGHHKKMNGDPVPEEVLRAQADLARIAALLDVDVGL